MQQVPPAPPQEIQPVVVVNTKNHYRQLVDQPYVQRVIQQPVPVIQPIIQTQTIPVVHQQIIPVSVSPMTNKAQPLPAQVLAPQINNIQMPAQYGTDLPVAHKSSSFSSVSSP
jgi:hypothetical protein